MRCSRAGVSASDFIFQRWQAGTSQIALVAEYTDWVAQQAVDEGADPATVQRYEVVVPSFMEIPGLVRYFTKAGGR